MISYHFLWDLVYLYNADIPWYKSHGAYIWQQSICWTFYFAGWVQLAFRKKTHEKGIVGVWWWCDRFARYRHSSSQ